MADVEKVINGLECAIDPDHYGFKNCHSCVYRKDIDHFQYVCDGDRCIMDALALLKSQEPGKVNITITQSDGWKEGNCPFCGMKVDSFYNWSFCGTCGRGLKWE